MLLNKQSLFTDVPVV